MIMTEDMTGTPRRRETTATTSTMKLSQAQLDQLEQLNTNIEKGLTTDDAAARLSESGGLNTVAPPIHCPAWICCLLPCLKHLKSMKAFRQIKPEDAEVLRNGKWIRYDATSLVKGDIIRLEERDMVPADCIVLCLDYDAVAPFETLLVDHCHVTGEDKPRSSAAVEPRNNTSTKVAARPVPWRW
jgi:hypothetical protein